MRTFFFCLTVLVASVSMADGHDFEELDFEVTTTPTKASVLVHSHENPTLAQEYAPQQAPVQQVPQTDNNCCNQQVRVYQAPQATCYPKSCGCRTACSCYTYCPPKICYRWVPYVDYERCVIGYTGLLGCMPVYNYYPVYKWRYESYYSY